MKTVICHITVEELEERLAVHVSNSYFIQQIFITGLRCAQPW